MMIVNLIACKMLVAAIFSKAFFLMVVKCRTVWERLTPKKTVKSYADCDKGLAAPKLNGNGVIYGVIPIKRIDNRN